MLSVQRPSQLNRALSSPTGTQMLPDMASPTTRQFAPFSNLTPPVSPISVKHSRSSSDLNNLDETLSTSDHHTPVREQQTAQAKFQDVGRQQNRQDGILCCPFDIDNVQDGRGRDQLFGTGAWSIVYKATPSRPATTSRGLLTPPSSPIAPLPIIVAIKKPARPDAKSILKNEATILSYLNDLTQSQKYVIPFYGMIGESLVLAALPLSLNDHIRRCASATSQTITHANMHLPVIGSEQVWLDFALKMVSALAWLQESAEVIHGDIKPGNILLSPIIPAPSLSPQAVDSSSNGVFPFQPLLIDFSSSHRTSTVTSNGSVPLGTLSAVTREYTAPEFLKSSVLSDPSSTATKASDVFSMAITLLVAATGNTAVYDGSVFQRQYMATQGWQAVQFVQSGSCGARVPRFGIVARVVERAVLKHDMGRVKVKTWLEIVESIMRGEPVKD